MNALFQTAKQRLGRCPDQAPGPGGLDFRLPWLAWLAVAFFFTVNLTCILNARGVADPEGYALSTSKPFQVNIYDDDGAVSLHHALGYYHGVYDTFSIATNFGGPLLHAAKPVMRLASGLGVFTRFDSPDQYTLYPGELLKAWKVFGVFKLLLMLGLPAVFYLLGANFVSRGAGLLACWMAALLPAVPVFEMRMKPDGVVLMLTLWAVLFLLEYVRSGRGRPLYAAAVLMGLSFAMKFTMALLAPLYLLLFWTGARRHGGLDRARLLLLVKSLVLAVAVFLLSNPLLLENPGIFLSFIGRYTAIALNPDLPQSFWWTAQYRLRHFEPFLGPVLNLLVLPALAVLIARAARRRLALDAPTVILLLFLANVAYLWKIAHNHVVDNITYYYYGQSLLVTLLIALALREAWVWLRAGGVLRAGLADALALGAGFVLAATLSTQLDVTRYMCGPSSRQEVHAWAKANIPPDAVIGTGASSPGHVQFLERILLDPFRNPLANLGRPARDVDRLRPDYVLWYRTHRFEPEFTDPRYTLVAEFDSSKRLPRETWNFMQNDLYQVFRRTGGAPGATPPRPAAPNAGEVFLDRALGGVPGGFTVLCYRSLGEFPLSTRLVLRQPQGFSPLPPSVMTGTYRPPSAPVEYAHQLPPEALTFWGVRYVLALQDQAFAHDTLGDARYALKPEAGPVDTPGGQVALYENAAFAGQAFFLADPDPQAVYRQSQRYLGLLARHRPKSYGRLYPEAFLKRFQPKLLRVRMVVEATGTMDLLLKAGRTRSVILPKGQSVVDLPLAVDQAGEVGYEINPAQAGATCAVRSVEAWPINPRPADEVVSCDLSGAFVRVRAAAPGVLTVALPNVPGWLADADSRQARVLPGPAGTVAVPLGTGEHLVRLYRDR
ncbi:hypothetical protein JCM15519_19060 [Fundidesulfovibrio butyratiphilus]